MNDFAADWLALREPADRAARDAGLVDRVARFLAGRPDPLIVDLGAGTGSTLRAVGRRFGARQRWLLVDGDRRLVAEGQALIAAWAAAEGLTLSTRGDAFELVGDGRRIAVRWHVADLAGDPLPVAGPVDLVTASAFFDLVSGAFVDRLAAMTAARRAGFYAALDVDGADSWSPAHPDDAAVAAAFRADQTRDKGFGPALGPRATEALAAAFAAAGYAVATAASPWRIDGDGHPLAIALAHGWAAAAAIQGAAAPAAAWRASRLAAGGVRGCVIGHRDLWAEPPLA